MSKTNKATGNCGTSRCYASVRTIRSLIHYGIAIPTFVFMVAFVTACGAPLAILFFLLVSPFATIHWAFTANKSWWESWKDSAKIFTD